MKIIDTHVSRVRFAVVAFLLVLSPCFAMRRGTGFVNKLPSLTRGFSAKARRVERQPFMKPSPSNLTWRNVTKPQVTPPSAIPVEPKLVSKLVREEAVNKWGTYFRNLNQIMQAVFLWPAAVGTAVFSYFNPQLFKQKLSEFIKIKQQPDSDIDIEIESEGRKGDMPYTPINTVSEGGRNESTTK